MKEVVNLKKEAFRTWLWPRLLWKQKQRCGGNLGKILADWRTGLVVPIFKKEDRSAPIIGVLLTQPPWEKLLHGAGKEARPRNIGPALYLLMPARGSLAIFHSGLHVFCGSGGHL